MAIDIKALRRRLADATQVSQDLATVISAEATLVDTTKSTANKAKESQVLEQLALLPIDKLKDATESTIRTETLRKYGHSNVASIYHSSVAQLERIPGITAESATEIKSLADSMHAAIAQSISYGINFNDLSETDRDLITSLQGLDTIRTATRGATPSMKPLADSINQALTKTKPLQSRLRWFFTSHEGRDAALDAAGSIALLLGQPSALIAIEAARAGLKAINERSTSRAPQDFTQRASDYYAILEDVTGTRPSSDLNRHFNQELLDKIEAQELQTSLIKATMRRYQTFGGKFALTQDRVIIGDEMGLGKTLQAISAMAHRHANGAHRFLVVCPASVIINWTREIESRSDLSVIKIHGEEHKRALGTWIEKGGIGLTTFDTIKTFALTGDEILALGIDTIVVDEAHYIKNLHTGRARTIVQWIDRAPHVIFLTGTPMENRVGEFINLAKLLDPKLGGSLDRTILASGPEAFKSAVAPIYLRRNSNEVLQELPELIEVSEFCTWQGADFDAYISATVRGNFMGMRQASFLPIGNQIPSKLERLLELVEQSFETGQKVIVFSYFRKTIDLITQHLGDRAIGPITGSVSSAQRQFLVDQFQDSPTPKVLVGQIQAAGTGLNIQSASVVILCEPQIKPSLEAQAIARAHRMGQVRTVQVHRLLVLDSVDEKMLKMLARKQADFNDFARDSALADSSAQAKDINEESMATVIVMAERKRLGLEESGDVVIHDEE